MTEEKRFTWIKTHEEIAKFISTKENSQKDLIELLKKVGISPLNDKDANGVIFDLEEIDPLTFFCYIYKYGTDKRLKFLQEIAKELGLSEIPEDDYGIPSVNAQKVWFFPYSSERKNNEIKRLWNFFHAVINDQINDDLFNDILKIKNVGKTKITEVLFDIFPDKYFPINGPTKPYLKEELQIPPEFNTFTEYLEILKKVKEKTNKHFYELSYDSWVWNENNKKINYWIFQGNPKFFNVVESIRKNDLKTWLVNSHKSEIKKGDKIIFWVTGENRGCYALGEVISDIYEGLDDECEIKYYSDPNDRKVSSRVNIKITENFTDRPIKKEQIDSVEKLSELKIGNQGTNFSATEKEYLALLDIYNMKMNVGNSMVAYPLNIIFYGPPGTGKTYNTILRAAEIVENRKIDSYSEALKIFRTNLHDRIEFITFHQNYSYEDFIQGLRPDVEIKGQLSFEKKDGIFKRIADKALQNIKDAQKAPEEISKSVAFANALEMLKDKVLEDVEKIQINETAYFIAAEDDAFRYTGNNWTLSDKGSAVFRMKYIDLLKFYEENVKSRQDIKKLNNVSGLAKQHASYYFKAFELVKSLMSSKSNVVEKPKQQNYVLIIDEINRANISRVFGELITLIEPDKRSHGEIPLEAKLPSGDSFIVPSNLYIIGSMNTADKSISLLDIALRRRFEFEAMYPEYEIEGFEIYDKEILKKINDQITKLKGHDFQIGHAYFMGENRDLIHRMNKKVIPLLLEYFMNDEKEVKGILYNSGLQVVENSWPIRISGKRD